MFVFVVLPSRRAGAGLHSPAQHNHRASTHDYRRSRQRARLLAVATSKATNHLQEQPEAWENMADPGPGPAFKHSLRALEWSTVCQHIAAFASTLAGKQLCEDPVISTSYEEASVRTCFLYVCCACVWSSLSRGARCIHHCCRTNSIPARNSFHRNSLLACDAFEDGGMEYGAVALRLDCNHVQRSLFHRFIVPERTETVPSVSYAA